MQVIIALAFSHRSQDIITRTEPSVVCIIDPAQAPGYNDGPQRLRGDKQILGDSSGFGVKLINPRLIWVIIR